MHRTVTPWILLGFPNGSLVPIHTPGGRQCRKSLLSQETTHCNTEKRPSTKDLIFQSTLQPRGTQTICSKFERFVWQYYEEGIMTIFFFKINVNLTQLLYFVVLAAVNGEYWRFWRICVQRLPESNRRKSFSYYSQVLGKRRTRQFALKTNLLIFPNKSFKFRTDCLSALWSNALTDTWHRA